MKSIECIAKSYQAPGVAVGKLVVLMSLIAILLMVLSGCTSSKTGRLPESSSDLMELDAGYVILRELLIDESRLDGVLLIKSASDSTESLIRDIAEASSDMLKELDSMADENPELTMAFNGLPEVEKAVREAMASRTAMELMGSRGDMFEHSVLLSQDKAMSYGMHLAESLSRMEPDITVSGQFMRMSNRMSALHSRVKDRLESLCDGSG